MRQPLQGKLARRICIAAHFNLRLQTTAKRWPFWLPKQFATQIRIQLYTGHTRWLAIWHAGNRAGDTGRNTARRATGLTIHDLSIQI
jgi:hypothetical protein